MQINYKGTDKFVVKAKEATITLESSEVDIEGLKITGPGEYERKGIFVEGISPNGNGPVYVVRADHITICYLGKLKNAISDDAAKQIGDIDILIVPLGEEGTIGEKEVGKVIAQIDPRIVIPMLYSDIEPFKKTEGITGEAIDSLRLKKADLPEEDRKFYILKDK